MTRFMDHSSSNSSRCSSRSSSSSSSSSRYNDTVVEVEMGRCTVVVVLNFSSRGWTHMAMKSSSSFSLAPFSF